MSAEGYKPGEDEVSKPFEKGEIQHGDAKEIADSLENASAQGEVTKLLHEDEVKKREKTDIGNDLVLLGNKDADISQRKAALDRLRNDGLRIKPDDDDAVLNSPILGPIYKDSGTFLLDDSKKGTHVNAAAWLKNARDDLATEDEVESGTIKSKEKSSEEPEIELPETGKKEKFKAPENDKDLREYFDKIHKIGNLDIEDRLLNNLVNTYVDREEFELLALVAERKNVLEAEKAKQKKLEAVKNIEGIPTDLENKTEWRKWARARLTRVLVSGGRFSRDIFSAVSENAVFGGKQEIDGSLYMPSDVSDEIKGKIRPDGSLEIWGEVEVAQEVGKAILEWKKAHKKMPQMVATYDAMGKGGEYDFPRARLVKFLFNDLKGEDGTPEGGSKNVAKALQLYWAMAHLGDKEERVVKEGDKYEPARAKESFMAETIMVENGVFEAFLKMKKLVAEGVDFSTLSPTEFDNYMDMGLKEFKSIFNSPIPVEEVDLTRAAIAKCCGGTFYENIGLYFAGVYGITAWGSDSIAPGIEDNDAMGLMIHTESQRFMDRVPENTPRVNNDDRLSAGKRGVRYLDDVVANALNVYDKNENPIKIQVSWTDKDKGSKNKYTGWEYIPVRFGKHSETIQELKDAKEEKFFYIVRKRDEQKFRIFKSAKSLEASTKTTINTDQVTGNLTLEQISPNDSIYEEVTLDQLIREGRMNEVDWEGGLDLSGLLRLRESRAVGMWKLFKNLEDDFTKLALPDLVGKKENFEDCLPEYNRATIQHTAFLWLYSLLSKNKSRIATLAPDMKRVISDAVKAELISGKMSLKLRMEFKLI